MNKRSRGTFVARVEQLKGVGVVGGVEQLRGVVAIVDDDCDFLVMLRMKDLQWSCNSRCDPKLNAIFHIKMIVLQFFYYKH